MLIFNPENANKTLSLLLVHLLLLVTRVLVIWGIFTSLALKNLVITSAADRLGKPIHHLVTYLCTGRKRKIHTILKYFMYAKVYPVKFSLHFNWYIILIKVECWKVVTFSYKVFKPANKLVCHLKRVEKITKALISNKNTASKPNYFK